MKAKADVTKATEDLDTATKTAAADAAESEVGRKRRCRGSATAVAASVLLEPLVPDINSTVTAKAWAAGSTVCPV